MFIYHTYISIVDNNDQKDRSISYTFFYSRIWSTA